MTNAKFPSPHQLNPSGDGTWKSLYFKTGSQRGAVGASRKQHHFRTLYKCKDGFTPDELIPKIWGWGLSIWFNKPFPWLCCTLKLKKHCLKSSPGDSKEQPVLRTNVIDQCFYIFFQIPNIYLKDQHVTQKRNNLVKLRCQSWISLPLIHPEQFSA